MTQDLGPRLSAQLEDAGARVDVPAGDIDMLVANVRRRAHRQRILSGVVAVAFMASTFGIVLARRGDEGTPLGAGPGPSIARGSLGLTWSRVDPESALGMYRGISSGTPLYALSTSPGERFPRDGRPMTRVVWTSDDGVDWTAASTLGDDLYLADLTTRDERIYAIGTSPATTRVGSGPKAELVVGWSDDGAESWQHEPLPVDWEALARNATTVQIQGTEIASGPAGTVAVAQLWTQLDARKWLPDGVTAPNGWSITDSGIDLLGELRSDICPEGTTVRVEEIDPRREAVERGPAWCEPDDPGAKVKRTSSLLIPPQEAFGVIRSFTWADLGIDGELLGAMRRQPLVFFAPAGSTEFERVDVGDVSNAASPIVVDATDEGFVIVTSQPRDRWQIDDSTLVVLRSVDGREWTRETASGTGPWVGGIGRLAGRMAVVTGGNETVSLLTAGAAGGWTSTSLAEVVDPDVLGDRQVFPGVAAFGPFGLALHVILAPADGGNEDEISHRILLTRDGQTWDDIALEDLVDVEQGSWVSRITVVGDEVVIAVSLPATPGDADDEPKPRPQKVLVGSA